MHVLCVRVVYRLLYIHYIYAIFALAVFRNDTNIFTQHKRSLAQCFAQLRLCAALFAFLSLLLTLSFFRLFEFPHPQLVTQLFCYKCHVSKLKLRQTKRSQEGSASEDIIQLFSLE